MLARLLKSSHPEDLRAANKLIKEMVQEVAAEPRAQGGGGMGVLSWATEMGLYVSSRGRSPAVTQGWHSREADGWATRVYREEFLAAWVTCCGWAFGRLATSLSKVRNELGLSIFLKIHKYM